MSPDRKPCHCIPGRCDLADANRDGRYCKIAEYDAPVSKLALAEERSRLFAKTADEQAEMAESNAEKARAFDWIEENKETFLVHSVNGWAVYRFQDGALVAPGPTLLDAVTKAMEGK